MKGFLTCLMIERRITENETHARTQSELCMSCKRVRARRVPAWHSTACTSMRTSMHVSAGTHVTAAERDPVAIQNQVTSPGEGARLV